MQNQVKRGRPRKENVTPSFNPATVKLFRGSDLNFNQSLFVVKFGIVISRIVL